MRKKRISITLVYVFLLFVTIPQPIAVAQDRSENNAAVSNVSFALKNGDRVVFLGNSLFENELQYGYLELALTTRWPGRDVTFRNIGWTGDTVFGDARSYISSPSAYDLLIEQLANTQPTIVFIAYGGIEALEGEAGLSRFSKGLNRLLDKVDELGAKAVLLSPLPLLASSSSEDLVRRNTMLDLYTSAIAATASERAILFIDIFKSFSARNKTATLSDNGLHLNENGYYYLASVIEEQLGLTPRKQLLTIDVSRQTAEATTSAGIVNTENKDGNIQFMIDEEYLPLPLPAAQQPGVYNGRVLRITGLRRGFYTLSADGAQMITASADKWKEGVAINSGPSFSQAAQLREKIIKKNELFFHQYRPLNRTYIIGFRSHEQGRHAKGLDDLSVIITWLEGQIALNRMPKPENYKLTRIK